MKGIETPKPTLNKVNQGSMLRIDNSKVDINEFGSLGTANSND